MSRLHYQMAGFNDELLKLAGRSPKAMSNLLAGTGKFLKRQVHSVTGWTPQGFLNPAGARELGAGDIDSSLQAVSAARKKLQAARTMQPGMLDQLIGNTTADVRRKAKSKATEELAQHKKGLELSHKATSMGLTSIPGYLKSLATNGVGDTIATGARQQWHTSGPVGKGLMFGLPAAGVASAIVKKPEEGHTRLSDTALAASMAPMGPIPFGGQIAMGLGADKLFKRKPKAQQVRTLLPEYTPPATSEAISPGVERSVSHSAAGMPPGDMLGGSPG